MASATIREMRPSVRQEISSRESRTCGECGKVFRRPDGLRRHLRWDHGTETLFVCTVSGCDRQFASSHALKSHSTTHAPESAYKCPACACSFTRREHLYRHMEMHDGARLYPCKHCGSTFRRRVDAGKHARECGRVGGHCCVWPECNKSFSKASSLALHAKKHTAIRRRGRVAATAPEAQHGSESFQFPSIAHGDGGAYSIQHSVARHSTTSTTSSMVRSSSPVSRVTVSSCSSVCGEDAVLDCIIVGGSASGDEEGDWSSDEDVVNQSAEDDDVAGEAETCNTSAADDIFQTCMLSEGISDESNVGESVADKGTADVCILGESGREEICIDKGIADDGVVGEGMEQIVEVKGGVEEKATDKEIADQEIAEGSVVEGSIRDEYLVGEGTSGVSVSEERLIDECMPDEGTGNDSAVADLVMDNHNADEGAAGECKVFPSVTDERFAFDGIQGESAFGEVVKDKYVAVERGMEESARDECLAVAATGDDSAVEDLVMDRYVADKGAAGEFKVFESVMDECFPDEGIEGQCALGGVVKDKYVAGESRMEESVMDEPFADEYFEDWGVTSDESTLTAAESHFGSDGVQHSSYGTGSRDSIMGALMSLVTTAEKALAHVLHSPPARKHSSVGFPAWAPEWNVHSSPNSANGVERYRKTAWRIWRADIVGRGISPVASCFYVWNTAAMTLDLRLLAPTETGGWAPLPDGGGIPFSVPLDMISSVQCTVRTLEVSVAQHDPGKAVLVQFECKRTYLGFLHFLSAWVDIEVQ